MRKHFFTLVVCSLVLTISWTAGAMEKRRKIIPTIPTISFRKLKPDGIQPGVRIQAVVNDCITVGQIRFEGNRIHNLFVMNGYENTEVKADLFRICIAQIKREKHTKVLLTADRDMSFYQRFGAQAIEQPWRLNSSEDYSAEMELHCNQHEFLGE